MKIKHGFVKKKVGDVDVVVAVGDRSVGFNALITLNTSASFLWDLLVSGATKEELLAAMLEKYDIDEATAKADIIAFLKKANDAGVLDD